MIKAEIVDGRIIADTLPNVGECINVNKFGLAQVERLQHNNFDNYIVLMWVGTPFLTSYVATYPFEVRKVA